MYDVIVITWAQYNKMESQRVPGDPSSIRLYLKKTKRSYLEVSLNLFLLSSRLAGAVTRILHCWCCDDTLLMQQVLVQRQCEDSVTLPSRNPRRKRCCTVTLDLLLTVPGEASTHVTKTIVCCLCLLVNRLP